MDQCDSSVNSSSLALRLRLRLIIYEPQHLSVVDDEFIEPGKKEVATFLSVSEEEEL